MRAATNRLKMGSRTSSPPIRHNRMNSRFSERSSSWGDISLGDISYRSVHNQPSVSGGGLQAGSFPRSLSENPIWLRAACLATGLRPAVSTIYTDIACFAVLASHKTARSRADDGILRHTPSPQSLRIFSMTSAWGGSDTSSISICWSTGVLGCCFSHYSTTPLLQRRPWKLVLFTEPRTLNPLLTSNAEPRALFKQRE